MWQNIKFQGYNGSQLWDAAFAVQAIISTDLVEEFGPTLRKAHTFLKNSQVNLEFPYAIYCILLLLILCFIFHGNYLTISLSLGLKVSDDCPGNLAYWYRHISKGAWPFSTADHGWPISDCTAEGLKVITFSLKFTFTEFNLFSPTTTKKKSVQISITILVTCVYHFRRHWHCQSYQQKLSVNHWMQSGFMMLWMLFFHFRYCTSVTDWTLLIY